MNSFRKNGTNVSVSSADPLPVAVASGGAATGPGASSGATRVTPASDSPAFPVAGVARGTAPAYAEGAKADLRTDLSGALVVRSLGIKFLASDGWGNDSMSAFQADAGGTIPVYGGYHFNGTSWDRIRGDTTNGLFVQLRGPGATNPPYVLSNDGDGNGAFIQGLVANAMNRVYNAVNGSWDRMRGNRKAVFTSEPTSAGNNRSITVSTTSQTLMAAAADRHKFIIKNDTGTDVWINLGGTATAAAGAGNIKIAANSYFELQGTTSAVTIIATAAAAITCYEF